MKDDLTAAVIIILYGIGSILTDGETDLFFYWAIRGYNYG